MNVLILLWGVNFLGLLILEKPLFQFIQVMCRKAWVHQLHLLVIIYLFINSLVESYFFVSGNRRAGWYKIQCFQWWWITLGHLSIMDGSASNNWISWCLLVCRSSLVIPENRKRGTTNMEFFGWYWGGCFTSSQALIGTSPF